MGSAYGRDNEHHDAVAGEEDRRSIRCDRPPKSGQATATTAVRTIITSAVRVLDWCSLDPDRPGRGCASPTACTGTGASRRGSPAAEPRVSSAVTGYARNEDPVTTPPITPRRRFGTPLHRQSTAAVRSSHFSRLSVISLVSWSVGITQPRQPTSSRRTTRSSHPETSSTWTTSNRVPATSCRPPPRRGGLRSRRPSSGVSGPGPSVRAAPAGRRPCPHRGAERARRREPETPPSAMGCPAPCSTGRPRRSR